MFWRANQNTFSDKKLTCTENLQTHMEAGKCLQELRGQGRVMAEIRQSWKILEVTDKTRGEEKEGAQDHVLEKVPDLTG